MRHLLLLAPLVIAACATPLEQCISAATKDLNIVNQLIEETEGTLVRGYALEEERYLDRDFTFCTDDETGNRYGCWVTTEETRTVPRAVDLDAERDKLNSLIAKRGELRAKAARDVETCRASYPAEAV